MYASHAPQQQSSTPFPSLITVVHIECLYGAVHMLYNTKFGNFDTPLLTHNRFGKNYCPDCPSMHYVICCHLCVQNPKSFSIGIPNWHPRTIELFVNIFHFQNWQLSKNITLTISIHCYDNDWGFTFNVIHHDVLPWQPYCLYTSCTWYSNIFVK